MFMLHPRLKEDTVEVTRLRLSLVLLMNDRALPWLILVPARKELREIHDLDRNDRRVLIEEIALASAIIKRLYLPDKINVGVLGNLVPQLHVHVIGRFAADRAWPGPIWGTGPSTPYTPEELNLHCTTIREAFQKGA
ncbi:MAG: HIT family protein [Nitrospirota bacterium]